MCWSLLFDIWVKKTNYYFDGQCPYEVPHRPFFVHSVARQFRFYFVKMWSKYRIPPLWNRNASALLWKMKSASSWSVCVRWPPVGLAYECQIQFPNLATCEAADQLSSSRPTQWVSANCWVRKSEINQSENISISRTPPVLLPLWDWDSSSRGLEAKHILTEPNLYPTSTENNEIFTILARIPLFGACEVEELALGCQIVGGNEVQCSTFCSCCHSLF